MPKQRSVASICMFVGSILCFFLPFATVSCNGADLLTLSGQQLATGTTLERPGVWGGPPQKQQIDFEPLAAVAWLCAAIGAGLSFLGSRLAKVTAASGAAGVLSLLVMRFRMDADLQKQGMGAAHIEYGSGFTLTVMLFFIGLAWNVYLVIKRKDLAADGPPQGGNS